MATLFGLDGTTWTYMLRPVSTHLRNPQWSLMTDRWARTRSGADCQAAHTRVYLLRPECCGCTLFQLNNWRGSMLDHRHLHELTYWGNRTISVIWIRQVQSSLKMRSVAGSTTCTGQFNQETYDFTSFISHCSLGQRSAGLYLPREFGCTCLGQRIVGISFWLVI